VRKLRNKELSFIGDEETIRTVKKQLETGEWDISSKYVDDSDLRMLVKMGLTLRSLDDDKLLDKLHNLKKEKLSNS